MAYRCAVCQKGPVAGNSYSHSHRATRRVFRPNLQRQTILYKGTPKKVYVCTGCIRSDRARRYTASPSSRK
ncbi:MAG: 50S ribosomal protein L28 [Elusimicrobia bacterium RIFCSPLOWO2_12_FULL_59_9]|nr:MAG: 50S ribosomal protein L28 [Elusimicrobia bacterium RIFCSPLOWO2_12_FULL_59_9]